MCLSLKIENIITILTCLKPTIPKKEIDLAKQENEYIPKEGRKKALLN
jgi:hypothetical protein